MQHPDVKLTLHPDVKIAIDEQGVVPIISTLPSRCYWSGTARMSSNHVLDRLLTMLAATCEGECNGGETYCGRNGCGAGKCCASGWKVLCCRGDCPSDSMTQAFERVMRESEKQKHFEMK